MLIDILLVVVKFALSLVFAILPVMTTPPAWLAYIVEPIVNSFGWLNDWLNVPVLFVFIGAIMPVVIIWQLFHKVDQEIAMARGVALDKSSF